MGVVTSLQYADSGERRKTTWRTPRTPRGGMVGRPEPAYTLEYLAAPMRALSLGGGSGGGSGSHDRAVGAPVPAYKTTGGAASSSASAYIQLHQPHAPATHLPTTSALLHAQQQQQQHHHQQQQQHQQQQLLFQQQQQQQQQHLLSQSSHLYARSSLPLSASPHHAHGSLGASQSGAQYPPAALTGGYSSYSTFPVVAAPQYEVMDPRYMHAYASAMSAYYSSATAAAQTVLSDHPLLQPIKIMILERSSRGWCVCVVWSRVRKSSISSNSNS